MDPKKYEFVLPVGTVVKAHFKNQETGKWEDRSYTIEQVVNGHPLRIGQKIRPGDDVRPVLGQGGFGITYLASYLHKDQNNVFKNYYAIKEFFLKEHCWRDEGSTVMRYSPAAKENVENGLKEFKAEGERLYRICRGNRNIVNVNETFECNGTAYYAMEYIEGGSLRDVVRSQGSALREGVALSYIRPICEAVQYIHENFGLLHCDIKPDNIMLRLDADGQPREPVLIDFGISIHFNKKGEATTTHSSIGVSPGYSPQEQYQGLEVIMETREKARKDGLANLPLLPYEIDVYALGATLYYLVTGKDPDVASFSLESQLDKRLQTAGVSDRMRTVITSAMRQNPMSRTSTVKGFLQGFEERYCLPQGFILRGPNRSYQIMTGLMEEGSFFLRYEAVEYTKPQNVSGGITTKSQQYHIYECYDKTLHHRNRDESVGISERSTTTAFEAFHGLMGEKTGLEAPGEQVDAHGVMACEYFMANGTEYFVVRHGYKPPMESFFSKLGPALTGFIQRNKRGIIGACLALAICAGGYWAVGAYKKHRAKVEVEKMERSKELSAAIEASDRDVLERFAKDDSLRAINALANLAKADSTAAAAEVVEKAQQDLAVDKVQDAIQAADKTAKEAEQQTLKSAEAEKKLAEQQAQEKARKEQEDKKKETANSQAENARLALQYVNGERTEANHSKALSYALKADPATKARVIQKLKDLDYLPAFNY